MRTTLAITSLGLAASSSCDFASTYPRQYVALKTKALSADTLDGDLNKPVWANVKFTDDFVDIQGSPDPQPTPRFRTRAKMVYDDTNLYVAAIMEEPDVWASITDPQEIIFHDDDFEVFIDSNATTYFYKETEVNAFGALWSLCLNRAYGDGGYENSTRVMEPGFDMMDHGLTSAVQVQPPNCINDNATPCTSWTVELAMPLDQIQINATHPVLEGEFWRIDFSRVEWRVLANDTSPTSYVKDPAYPNEDNWVWNPIGPISMHQPDMWGILQFGNFDTDAAPAEEIYYAEWPARRLAMNTYYAQHSFASANNNTYATSVEQLGEFAPDGEETFVCGDVEITLETEFNGFVAVADLGGYTATVDQSRFLTET